jgi:DNA-binding CsgD family transcriptional regulator
MSKATAIHASATVLDTRILALHSAIDRESLWTGVRDVLACVADFSRLTLFLGHLGLGEARVVYSEPEIKNAGAWFEARGKLNPFSPWIKQHIGAPYFLFRDIIGRPAEFHASPFYQAFAQPEGWDKGLSVMFWKHEEMLAMFSLYRGEHQLDFTPAQLKRILTIARHIEIAVARVQRIHHELNFRNALQSFTRTLPVPLLLLNWRGKLVFANLAAYESAAIWNFGAAEARAYNPRECFQVPDPALTAVQTLKQTIQSIKPQELSSQMPAPIVITHTSDPRLNASVSPAYFGQSSLARPGFFVLFKDPLGLDETLEPEVRDARRRRALASLTRAEREVVRLLCQGASNTEVATALNKSVLTVKTQVNSIFRKLGLRSRTQLVAKLK